jgi:hypothetical protein
MSLGSSFPPGFVEAQVKRQLRPGAVIKLLRIMDDGKPHEKRFVVLHVDDHTITCVINSAINSFIAQRPALLQCQVSISASIHASMNHDSHVDCSRIHRWATEDVLRDLAQQPNWILGEITTALRDDIVGALKFARTLSTAEISVYCESLASLR